MSKLTRAIKALKIYDECMCELSQFVGHMAGRCGEQLHHNMVEVCKRAMLAQKTLDELTGDIRALNGRSDK